MAAQLTKVWLNFGIWAASLQPGSKVRFSDVQKKFGVSYPTARVMLEALVDTGGWVFGDTREFGPRGARRVVHVKKLEPVMEEVERPETGKPDSDPQGRLFGDLV